MPRHSVERGEKNINAKLTAVQVEDIRRKYASGQYLQRELADIYHIHRNTISDIMKCKTWKALLPAYYREHPYYIN